MADRATAADAGTDEVSSASPPRPRRGQMAVQQLIAAGLAALIGIGVSRFPVAVTGLGLGLVIYAVLLGRFPRLWLLVLPGAAALLDFRLLTGWALVDAFDLVMATTLATVLWQRPLRLADWRLDGLAAAALLLFAASHLISMAIALVPPPPLDADGWFGYLTPYNAVRVGKGALWALILVPLFGQARAAGARPALALGYGVLAALLGVGLVVGWERMTFPGPLNFSDEYRIFATFADMQVGGGTIDAFLVAALPFAAVPFAVAASRGFRMIGLGIGALGLHAVLVTFSRGAYGAAAAAIAVLGAGFAARFAARFTAPWLRARDHGRAAAFGLIGAIAFGAVVLVALALTPYMQTRLATLPADFATRIAHWADALDLPQGGRAAAFGTGVGSYPRLNQDRLAPAARPGRFSLVDTGADARLRLTGGSPLYYRQSVAVMPGTEYRLVLDARRIGATPARLAVHLCEQALNYSFRCIEKWVPDPGPDWQTAEATLASGTVGAPLGRLPGLFQRPVHFALYLPRGVVEIDNIRLQGPDGGDLIRNGDFAQGGAYWYFDVDDKAPWHVDNDGVYTLVEKGWVGLAAWMLLIAACLARLTRAVAAGSRLAAIYLAATVGIIVVGLANSPLDAPRSAFFVVLILVAALAAEWRPLSQDRATGDQAAGDQAAGDHPAGN